MRGKKYFSRMLSTLCAVLITSVFVTVPAEAAQFDPAFYGAAYPDVAAFKPLSDLWNGGRQISGG